MKTFECDTCEGVGEILAMVPGGTGMPVEDMIECPDCDGVGLIFVTEPKHPHLARIHRGWSMLTDSLVGAWRSWRRGNGDVIAARITVHRSVFADEPRAVEIVNRDLRRSLARARSYGWFRADLAWSLRNLGRTLRGREMLPLPYDVYVTTEIVDDGHAFEMGRTVILAEQRRVLR